MFSFIAKLNIYKIMETTRKISNVHCAVGCLDKTPKFMEERQKIIYLIDSVYKKHDAEKLETPVFELKEVYSNKKNKFDRILDLNDQGGEILSMRYDLKSSLTRYLAMCKIEKHIRISQFGNIYRKEAVNYDKLRLREFFVSDFDICGPSDPMLSEVQCLRVVCDVMSALSFNETYTIKIGHRKLNECCLRLATNNNDSQVVKLVNKLADENRRSMVDWSNIESLIGDNKITSSSLDNFKAIVDSYSGDLTEMIASLKSNEVLNTFKEFKPIIEEMSQLDSYCKHFLSASDYKKIRLDLSLIGSRSYFTGLTFAAWLNDSDKNVLSGGRYDNLITRINPKYKCKTSCTGFTVGVDQLVYHRLLKSGPTDLLLTTLITDNNNAEAVTNLVKKIKIDGKKEITEKEMGDENVLKNVKGTIDRSPQQMVTREKVFDIIVQCFKRQNACTIDTPVIERKDLLTGKYGEDSKLIYDLNDVDNEQLSLRYDLTVPFARYLAMHKEALGDNKMFKRYQIGKVYRRDQPSITTGRYREFYQCDFDIAGENQGLHMAPDAECLTIIYNVLRDLKLGDYKIKVNHRRFLDGLFEVCGVPESMFRTICSSVDKLDKTPWSKVYAEMLTKGLSKESADKIGEYVSLSGTVDLIDRLEQDSALISNANVQVALSDLRQLFGYCEGIMDRVSFDLSLARGLDYYTGVIFEAIFIGFESRAQEGEAAEAEEESQVSVGSVCGGGRYDNLVNMFSESDQHIPCVGFSFGVERLMAIYDKKRQLEGCAESDRRLVVVMTAQKNMVDERLRLLSLLLDCGVPAVHSMKKNPKALDVFQECDRLRIPWAVIIGEDELAADVVTLRHISTRKEEKVPRSDIVARLKAELAL